MAGANQQLKPRGVNKMLRHERKQLLRSLSATALTTVATVVLPAWLSAQQPLPSAPTMRILRWPANLLMPVAQETAAPSQNSDNNGVQAAAASLPLASTVPASP